MGRRRDLQAVLVDQLGSENVYFQPPPNVRLAYPCIIYKRDRDVVERADNGLYNHTKRYEVVVIDRDPDSEIPDKIAALPLCRFDRFYTVDGLNHDVYNLYF